MSSWLLTWNEHKTYWDDYEKDCEKTSKETPLVFTWSCCTPKIQTGDEVYLIRLGKNPRGIIAHGIVTQDVFQDEHWDEEKAAQGKLAYYVEAEYDTFLNYHKEEILDISVLNEKCNGQFWSPQQSGIRIKDSVIQILRELWAEVTKEYPQNPEESSYYTEGTKKTVYTTKYERDPKVRRIFLKGKKLKCEVCGFDFEAVYGALGRGYIEVHHKKPVSEGVRMTDLDRDLAMLCSNCHRMIHSRKNHMITIEELKKIIGTEK